MTQHVNPNRRSREVTSLKDSQTKGIEDIAAFYDDIYYANPRSQVVPSRHHVRLAARLGVTEGQRVLDVACGAGGWLAAAHARGARVSGVDISGRAIDVCRRHLPRGTFHCQPAESLPFADQQFDLVTCLGSLEHFLDQGAALREMVRVSRPDARLLILVPNSGFLSYRLGLYKGTWQQAVRETVRPLEEWAALFRASGLTVTERWKDLHVLSPGWILRGSWPAVPLRALQALMLPLWPLNWQYQVYHLARLSGPSSPRVAGPSG